MPRISENAIGAFLESCGETNIDEARTSLQEMLLEELRDVVTASLPTFTSDELIECRGTKEVVDLVETKVRSVLVSMINKRRPLCVAWRSVDYWFDYVADHIAMSEQERKEYYRLALRSSVLQESTTTISDPVCRYCQFSDGCDDAE